MFTTLPALTFAIYKAHFLPINTIPKIGGEIYNFIRSGYTGGHTDMYKPSGQNVYAYDVNSLYPYVMSEYQMPVGVPTYFEYPKAVELNVFTKDFTNPFGFFEVELQAPEISRLDERFLRPGLLLVEFTVLPRLLALSRIVSPLKMLFVLLFPGPFPGSLHTDSLTNCWRVYNQAIRDLIKPLFKIY